MLGNLTGPGLEVGVGVPGDAELSGEMLGPRCCLAPSRGPVLEASAPGSQACFLFGGLGKPRLVSQKGELKEVASLRGGVSFSS